MLLEVYYVHTVLSCNRMRLGSWVPNGSCGVGFGFNFMHSYSCSGILLSLDEHHPAGCYLLKVSLRFILELSVLREIQLLEVGLLLGLS